MPKEFKIFRLFILFHSAVATLDNVSKRCNDPRQITCSGPWSERGLVHGANKDKPKARPEVASARMRGLPALV